MSRLENKYRRRIDRGDLYCLHVLNGNTPGSRRQFFDALKKSGLISTIINIHREEFATVARFRKASGADDIVPEEPDFRVFEGFLEKHLADWLFKVTDVVTLQAKRLTKGHRFSHAELTALIDDAFLDRAADELPLRDGRNEIWDSRTLRAALNTVLPQIKTMGAVTLANVAKRINATRHPYVRTRRPLTAKHLQKLLKQHGIDWLQVKKSYAQRLLAKDRIA